MKDVIDLIVIAYEAHVKGNFPRRDELLKISTKTETAREQFIQFFETICSVETNEPQSEKNRMVEQVLREKYQL